MSFSKSNKVTKVMRAATAVALVAAALSPSSPSAQVDQRQQPVGVDALKMHYLGAICPEFVKAPFKACLRKHQREPSNNQQNIQQIEEEIPEQNNQQEIQEEIPEQAQQEGGQVEANPAVAAVQAPQAPPAEDPILAQGALNDQHYMDHYHNGGQYSMPEDVRNQIHRDQRAAARRGRQNQARMFREWERNKNRLPENYERPGQ